MNLRERLERLDRTLGSARQVAAAGSRAENLLLPGEPVELQHGKCWRLREEIDLSYRHGSVTLGELFSNDPHALVYLTKRPEYSKIRLDRLLFLDTETTGLSGGVGTVAFLVGLAYFEGEKLILEQWFMRDFSEERAILSATLKRIQRLAGEKGALVSFNGKTYDVPLLQNRAIFHRLLRELPQWPHVDLLHPSRRLWKRSVPDCSLGTLEARVLAVRRQGDVPGYLIPQRYFDYLKTGDPRQLLPVFAHNRLDLLSLVGLLHQLLQLFGRKEAAHTLHPDFFSMGRVYEEVKDFEAGEEFYRKLLQKTLPPQQKREVVLQLARLHKKRKRWPEAVSLWEAALREGSFAVEPYEELAKAFEHHLSDLERAKFYTEKALERVRMLSQLYGNSRFAEERSRLEWRLRRLNRKLSRSHASPESR